MRQHIARFQNCAHRKNAVMQDFTHDERRTTHDARLLLRTTHDARLLLTNQRYRNITDNLERLRADFVERILGRVPIGIVKIHYVDGVNACLL